MQCDQISSKKLEPLGSKTHSSDSGCNTTDEEQLVKTPAITPRIFEFIGGVVFTFEGSGQV